MSLKVIQFPQSPVHTPKSLAHSLRALADEVESGKISDLARIHVLFEHENEQLSYAAAGKTVGYLHLMGVFAAATLVTSDQIGG